MMIDITRKSMFSGITRTRAMNVTHNQLAKWKTGTLVQDAFPHLSASDCEFLISGTTDEEWEEAFGEE